MTNELIALDTDPLIAAVIKQEIQGSVRYCTEDMAGRTLTDRAVNAALAAIGSCSALDWTQWSNELDRLRYESVPSRRIGE